MAAVIRELKDADENKVYPVTKASAVYLSNGVDTVGRVLDDQMDKNTDIVFDGNTIVETKPSGTVITTRFETDGSITETTAQDEKILESKVITFNADGSIHIEVEGE